MSTSGPGATGEGPLAAREADEAAGGGAGRHADRGAARRAVWRALAALGVLAVWLTIASIGGPLVGRLAEVQDNDNANFLPAGAEATIVANATTDFTGDQSLPYFLVFERPDGIRPTDTAALEELATSIPGLTIDVDRSKIIDPAVKDATFRLSDYLVPGPYPLVPSPDGKAVLIVVGLDSEAAVNNLPDGTTVIYGVAQSLRSAVAAATDSANSGNTGNTGNTASSGEAAGVVAAQISGYVTGAGGVLADLANAFAGIDGTLLEVTFGVVFLILLLVYRSPLLPLAALSSAVFALSAAALIIYPLADHGVIDLNGQSQGILFILVVGAATDYALLLVARYREELHDHPSKYVAMWRAWRASLPPIAASATTVILGLLCLLLADVGSTRGLGPIGAIGIAFAFVAGMTLLPTFLLLPSILLAVVLIGVGAALGAILGGPVAALMVGLVVAATFAVLAYLRRRELVRAAASGAEAHLAWYARPVSGRWLFWPRVPHLDHVHVEDSVGRSGIWGRVAGLVGRRPRTVAASSIVGLLVLAAFVPTLKADGIRQTDLFLNPMQSVRGQEALERHFPAGSGSPAQILVPVEDVAAATEAAAATPGVTSVVPYTGQEGGGPGGGDAAPPEPKVVDGKVLLQATLAMGADSPEAEAVVAKLRSGLDTVSPKALVGGPTAINLDLRDASNRDLRVIIPTILLVILIVLMILLRSVVAPVMIIIANVLSFGATLGMSAIVFNHVFKLPGGDPQIPLYGFVFLVGLGIDYSIFLMTRVREEAAHRGTRQGILVGLAVTGGVITSAGIVLAATFSALATLPISFLLQIAFLVAFGVLLDTLVVRSLLLPSASYLVGPRIWWPSHARADRR